MADLRISDAEAKDALARSGYLLESRVEAALRKRAGYYIETNSAYRDPETGKTRELDVWAMRAESAGPGKHNWLFYLLLIECVNNPQPLALFMRKPLLPPRFHLEQVKLSGLPIKFLRGQDWRTLADYLSMDKYHHYCKGRVANQFCSFVQKRSGRQNEWMATHETGHFDAFRKLCDAVDDFIHEHFKNWRYGKGEPEPVNIQLYYPVLVVQGNILAVTGAHRSVKLRKVKHAQYRRSAIRGERQEDYQIDVVTEKAFPQYLRMVETEVATTARRLRRRYKAACRAIERIVRVAGRERSLEKRRAAMEDV